MQGWTVPIQRASFRGVRFDVLAVDDELMRATCEHAYPFVNGTDVEDLGLNPLNVRLQAIFWGEGYYTDFKKFLSVMQDQGADVLMHPIRGRLPNMLCVSASFHHEADMIDYVAVDLTFVESTPAKPIFVFENSLLALIDKLISAIEDFVDDVMALYGAFMEIYSGVVNAKARLLNAWGALSGCYAQLRSLFDFDKSKYHVVSSISSDSVKQNAPSAMRDMLVMIDSGLTSVASRSDLTARAKFDEVMRSVAQVKAIPINLVTGANIDSAESAESAVSLKSLTQSLSKQDVQDMALMMQLGSTASLLKIATQLIENDDLIPSEIDYMTTKVRSEILANLTALRSQVSEQSLDDGEINLLTKPTTGFYTMAQAMAETLRQQAHELTQLAISAINRKPPLIIREVPFTGTVQQLAHAFYGDYRRSAELLRLNPQVRYPNFIEQGELLNSYAK